jgi:membrane protease YdiL (CAAX protease family)
MPMKPGSKLLLLVLSLLLPVVLLVCTQGFVMAQMHVAADDRALVWVQGGAQDISRAAERIEAHSVFSGGQVAAQTVGNPAPQPCGPNAVELSFGNLSLDDSQAAREELELVAARSGLTVCSSHRFRINDPSTDTTGGQLRFAGQHLLMFLGVPAGVCLCFYWMFREQFELPTLRAGQGLTNNVLLGLGGAVLAVCASLAIHSATGGPLFDTRGSQLPALGLITMVMALSLTVGSAMIEELAWRSWLITLSERSIGAWPAAAFSTALFALSGQPATADEALTLLTLGGICAALYVRTRSLAAAITAHAGYGLLTLTLGAAVG